MSEHPVEQQVDNPFYTEREARDLSGAVDQLRDGRETVLRDWMERVRANPKAINALLGKVMQASKGAAKPDLARRLLEERLG